MCFQASRPRYPDPISKSRELDCSERERETVGDGGQLRSKTNSNMRELFRLFRSYIYSSTTGNSDKPCMDEGLFTLFSLVLSTIIINIVVIVTVGVIMFIIVQAIQIRQIVAECSGLLWSYHQTCDLTAAIFHVEGFILVWCLTVEIPWTGRKCSPTGRLFHLQELYGREGGFQCNIYSDLFLLLARGPWEKTREDKQWTIGLRDEQWCQRSMCHYGM